MRKQSWLLLALLIPSVLLNFAQAQDAKQKKDADYYELMRMFVDTFEQIERNYVEDVDRVKLTQAAIRGMISELDPYSSYISPDDLVRFNQSVEQKFGGIGIQVAVDPDNKRLTVMTPLPGTPAYRAGVRAGDIIEEIEGKTTKGFTLQQAIKLLKGEAGQSVTIGIRHLGSNKIEKVKMEREEIEVATVLGDRYNPDGTWNFMMDPEKKVGLIRLTHFSRRSGAEMKAALEELVDQGMKSLVLDLRFNPGGLLSQAVEISDLFIDEGRIVSTKGKNSPERVWDASKDGTFENFPIAVLVNRYSASASEILSACLQDHERALVIGERSWGKGSVQNVIELQGGESALKLTTASYHRPSGENIHRFPESKESDVWGVMPDKGYLLKMTTKEMQDHLDYRRKRDVITKEGPPKSEYTDKQMGLALKYLEEKLSGKSTAEPAAPEKKKAAEATKPEKKKAALKTPKDAANQFGLLRILPQQVL